MISEERLLELWAADSGRPITLGKKRIVACARRVEAEARQDERLRIAQWLYELISLYGNEMSAGWLADQIKGTP